MTASIDMTRAAVARILSGERTSGVPHETYSSVELEAHRAVARAGRSTDIESTIAGRLAALT